MTRVEGEEIFQKGPNCSYRIVCEITGKCQEAETIEEIIRTGSKPQLERTLAGSACQNPQAISARQEAENKLASS